MLDSCRGDCKDKTLGDDNGFQIAKDYLKTVVYYKRIEKYLDKYDQEGCDDAMQQLLSQSHKGDGKTDSNNPNIEKCALHK